MIKIEVTSTELRAKRGTAKSGKPYSFREQTAFAHLAGKPYPVEFKVIRNDDEGAYAPGFYTLAPDSVFVDRFGSLGLSARLVPVK